MSIETDAIQYENDDLMRKDYGDDYGIACCVSAMRIGKEMQFFGARSNLPKTFLLALNGGFDIQSNMQIGPSMDVMKTDKLNHEAVWERLDVYLDWLCENYVNAMNIIHYMHDKYAYEKNTNGTPRHIGSSLHGIWYCWTLCYGRFTFCN